MDTRTALFEQYGPLLTYRQLAKILDRSSGGLKASMSKRGSEASRLLGSAKLRIGGRVYFRTEHIGEVLERGDFAGRILRPEEGA